MFLLLMTFHEVSQSRKAVLSRVKLPFLYCFYISLHFDHQKCTLATKFRGLVRKNISTYPLDIKTTYCFIFT